MRAWWVVVCLTGCLGIDPFERRMTVEDDVVLDGRVYKVELDAASGLIDKVTLGDDTIVVGGSHLRIDSDAGTVTNSLAAPEDTAFTPTLRGPVVAQSTATWQTGPYAVVQLVSAFPDGRIVRYDRISSDQPGLDVPTEITSQLTLGHDVMAMAGNTVGCAEFRPNSTESTNDGLFVGARVRFAGHAPAPGMPFGGSDVRPSITQVDTDETCDGNCNFELSTTIQIAGPDVFDVNNVNQNGAPNSCMNLQSHLSDEVVGMQNTGRTPPQLFGNGTEMKLQLDGMYAADRPFPNAPITISLTADQTPVAPMPKGFVVALLFEQPPASITIESTEAKLEIQLPSASDSRAFVWVSNVVENPIIIVPN